MKTTRGIIGFGALWALALSVPALAEQTRPARPDRSCALECRGDYRDCLDAARVEGRMCVAATCSAEQEAVKAACEASPTSDECAQARRALRVCAQPCLDEFGKARRVCRARAQECAEQCPRAMPTPQPGQKDPACVGECRDELRRCVAAQREAFGECKDSCNDEVAAARTACAAGRSAACAAARQAVAECLTPCNQALRTGMARCIEGAHDCVAECPNVTPPPTASRPLRGR